MPEIVFSKKEFQIWDFESFIFWSKFYLLGPDALGRFSRCFFFIFRRRPTMVTEIFTQPPTIKKLPTALHSHPDSPYPHPIPRIPPFPAFSPRIPVFPSHSLHSHQDSPHSHSDSLHFHHYLIQFPDSSFQLLQIACFYLMYIKMWLNHNNTLLFGQATK